MTRLDIAGPRRWLMQQADGWIGKARRGSGDQICYLLMPKKKKIDTRDQ